MCSRVAVLQRFTPSGVTCRRSGLVIVKEGKGMPILFGHSFCSFDESAANAFVILRAISLYLNSFF